MKKWKLKFGLPKGWELSIIIVVFILFALLDSTQNTYQPSGVNDGVNLGATTWFGVSAVSGFFLFFVLYNLGLFVIFSRALRKPSTSYRFDLVAGITAFVGLLLILSAGIGAIYFSAEEGLPYMLNIPQITVYHAGIFLQLISLLYFMLTD